ncbi:hypothetical protein PsorP6_018704 [Peronosclerospora sorghi]|nr:hypothetical protein PsorP6_018695 [Peronosclerospora sorghi]KAI9895369.1 hypothetical protein PsorP6_018704 [Peronosclerospora sorghi]
MFTSIRIEIVVLTLHTTVLLWVWWRQLRLNPEIAGQNKKIQELELKIAKKEKARVDERRGRIAAEKVISSQLNNQELRHVMEEKLNTGKGCFVQPVGIVYSCFKTSVVYIFGQVSAYCVHTNIFFIVGTPRQGSLAPSTRAKITFHRNISPETLIGLEDFSHVWIVFVFHQNTNGRNTRAHEGLRSDSHRHTFRVGAT